MTLNAGTRIGQYEVVAPLGQGGMGVVYRALDTKLQRPVALKFLAEDVADAAARRRFQREAQMASSLNHPHILTVYDVGEFEGRQYLVTELVDGGTLKDWARAARRTWRQVVDLLTGVADGLAAAHAAGILHRDIKPENVLVATNGYAKLADFGLAKLLEEAPDAATRAQTMSRTQPGAVIGTAAYMSPEQAAGKPVDARSDIGPCSTARNSESRRTSRARTRWSGAATRRARSSPASSREAGRSIFEKSRSPSSRWAIETVASTGSPRPSTGVPDMSLLRRSSQCLTMSVPIRASRRWSRA